MVLKLNIGELKMDLFTFIFVFIGTVFLFVVSVILHELSHYFAMRILGVIPNKPIVVLFQIPKNLLDPWGFVGSEDEIFVCTHDYFNIAWFLICISGGVGSSILMIPFYFLPYFHVSVLCMIAMQITVATLEGWNSLKPS